VNDRIQRIEKALVDEFSPVKLLVKDQSHLHAGHAGARSGLGHFDITIVAEKFSGANRLRRHKMVYAALGELMRSDIHAVRITARAPSEQ